MVWHMDVITLMWHGWSDTVNLEQTVWCNTAMWYFDLLIWMWVSHSGTPVIERTEQVPNSMRVFIYRECVYLGFISSPLFFQRYNWQEVFPLNKNKYSHSSFSRKGWETLLEFFKLPKWGPVVPGTTQTQILFNSTCL